MKPVPKTDEAYPSPTAIDPSAALERYWEIRHASDALCEPLAIEDYVIQSMPEASPTKWHLAHTTWFFEALILKPHLAGYETPDSAFDYLFNSYYNSIGKQFSRAERGMVSRPTVAEVQEYRRWVDEKMGELVASGDRSDLVGVLPLLELGLNHEQQHQELIITDLKHMFSKNPLHPAYRPEMEVAALEAPTFEHPVGAVPELEWHVFQEGLHCVGHDGVGGFAFDNEGPRHRVFLEAFRIASRLVTCGEYLEFITDGGYERPEFWLSDGWAMVQNAGWNAPLYWLQEGGEFMQVTLAGVRPVRCAEPVCHLSLYEADAYARWFGARLPSEHEWEVAADSILGRTAAGGEADPAANFVEEGHYHPKPITSDGAPGGQLLGDVWEWTRSAYSPYPGYRTPDGPLGEYNSKFMSGQNVLRGGSCATPRSHIRTTYRNFFPPSTRWQFCGLRLAKDG